MYTDAYGPDYGSKKLQFSLTDWVLIVPCSLHDSSNALKWALREMGTEFVQTETHIAIEALRNTYGPLHDKVAAFLVQHLRFREQSHQHDQVAAFWRALGVEADWIDLMVGVNPQFDGSLLYVNPSLKEDGECLDKVFICIVYCMKWKKFSVTRWLGFGSSCRLLTLSLAVGIQRITQMARDDANVSDYHLHGFSRCSHDVRKYAVVASIVTWVADAFAQPLMQDDRLLRQLSEVQEAVEHEVRTIQATSLYALKRLADIIGDVSPVQVRQWLVECAFKTASFISRKVIAPCKELPYPWACGKTSRPSFLFEGTEPCGDQNVFLVRWIF